MLQSPKAKKNPSSGALAKQDASQKELVGGNKESTTGSGANEYSGPPNHASRMAAGNQGIEPGPDRENFVDSSEGPESSQGSTLTKAGLK